MEDEIRAALVGLAVRDGKPDPALVGALADPSPVRRGAAAVALVEGGPATERIRIPDAIDDLVARTMAKDPAARPALAEIAAVFAGSSAVLDQAASG